jgi:hypothetical protein
MDIGLGVCMIPNEEAGVFWILYRECCVSQPAIDLEEPLEGFIRSSSLIPIVYRVLTKLFCILRSSWVLIELDTSYSGVFR